MRGDPEIISWLNEQLTSELTAINQYFLHAKMQQNWGLTKLAAYTRAESIDEMRHAEKLTDRLSKGEHELHDEAVVRRRAVGRPVDRHEHIDVFLLAAEATAELAA